MVSRSRIHHGLLGQCLPKHRLLDSWGALVKIRAPRRDQIVPYQFPLLENYPSAEASVYVVQQAGIHDFTKIGRSNDKPFSRTSAQRLRIAEVLPCPTVEIARHVELVAHQSLRLGGFDLIPRFFSTQREFFYCDRETAIKHARAAFFHVFQTLGANPLLLLNRQSAREALQLKKPLEQLQLPGIDHG